MDLDLLIDRFRGPLVGLLASWGASPRDAHELALREVDRERDPPDVRRQPVLHLRTRVVASSSGGNRCNRAEIGRGVSRSLPCQA